MLLVVLFTVSGNTVIAKLTQFSTQFTTESDFDNGGNINTTSSTNIKSISKLRKVLFHHDSTATFSTREGADDCCDHLRNGEHFYLSYTQPGPGGREIQFAAKKCEWQYEGDTAESSQEQFCENKLNSCFPDIRDPDWKFWDSNYQKAGRLGKTLKCRFYDRTSDK